MRNLKPVLLRSNAACALACVALLGHAATPEGTLAAPRATAAATSASAAMLPARPFAGDDPVAIRDVLAKQHIDASSPSLRDRVRNLIHIPELKSPHDPDLSKTDSGRELAFVIPVPHGVLYRSKTHALTVNADLSTDDAPGAILLRKTITGPRGRGLVVAPEAKSKGYIQHIDLIALKPDEGTKTTVHGHLTLSPAAFTQTNGNFAIVLMCRLAPPYLTDRSDHSDPTEDEPTDITTRTSTLHASIDAVWLISPEQGIVLSKNLHLSK